MKYEGTDYLIGKMDATVNEIEGYPPVHSFPTIRLYRQDGTQVTSLNVNIIEMSEPFAILNVFQKNVTEQKTYLTVSTLSNQSQQRFKFLSSGSGEGSGWIKKYHNTPNFQPLNFDQY